ncbi:MAG: argininosuccinate synthase, partial [Hoeflea sp.]|nr:argininosuccinate synthase [Hoeflea sp.]
MEYPLERPLVIPKRRRRQPIFAPGVFAAFEKLVARARSPIVRAHFRPAGRFSRRGPRPMSDIKKVVLAYSGGLDTSIILKWLQET